VTDRRTEILDAALRVLAEQGMRGLTHRAVDAAAAIAPGSTSYYFRSRAALVTGCVERLLELDVEREVHDLARSAPPDLLDVLVAVAVSMATTQRHRTLARYELSLAAVRDPDLRTALLAGGDTVRRLGAEAMAHAGAADPAAAVAELAAVIDGLVFTALVRGPDDPAELAAWLRPVLRRGLASLVGSGPP
jgi:DNA-binding transcriptional regulator YbjK